jgi:uncharacterized protein (TIRG00374 family)
LAQKQKPAEQLNREQEDVLKSIRVSRIILPLLIGVGAVAYLIWKQFDPEEFSSIEWTGRAMLWMLGAVGLAAIRHLAYAYRLRLLSGHFLSWRKSIELIFIWEFSSAVSPTSLGGSAVAFFILAQEKLSAARTATIVLYTIVVDSIFLLGSLPILYLIFGAGIMRPEAEGYFDVGGWGVYFLIAYAVMMGYSLLFFYGLFINPAQIGRLLIALTRFRPLRRFRIQAIETGAGMKIASEELSRQGRMFHLKAMIATALAWVPRFALLNFLIIAFIPELPLDFMTQFGLYARLETMFFIIAFSPTPGGAGLIELLFNGFLTDYVTKPTVSTTIATLWRVVSYWIYVLAGAIIIPNWLQGVLRNRRERKRQKDSQEVSH